VQQIKPAQLAFGAHCYNVDYIHTLLSDNRCATP